MIYLYIRQTVEEDMLWKEEFDIHFSARQAGGATHDMLVLHHVNDSCDIVLLLGWRNLAQAQTFVDSVSWQMSICKMGLVEEPEVWLLEKI